MAVLPCRTPILPHLHGDPADTVVDQYCYHLLFLQRGYFLICPLSDQVCLK